MINRRLTVAQRVFIQKYIETGSLTEAALVAYKGVKNRHTAAVIGSQNIRKPVVTQHLHNFDERFEMSDYKLIEKLKQALDAYKYVYNPITKEQMKVPDYSNQLKALEFIFKLKNYFASADRTEPVTHGIEVKFHYNKTK